MVKVSIIMPVYNGSKFLEKSIRSVMSQSFKDIELICVDDGSEDNSLEVLNGFAEKYDCIRVLTQEDPSSTQMSSISLND